MVEYMTLKDMDIADKRILMRLGADVPVDNEGNILDDSRLRLSVPTIRYALKEGAKQIILITHIGRPKDNEDNLKTDKLAQCLRNILSDSDDISPDDISKVDGWEIPKSNRSRIVMLENLRFNPNEKSKEQDERDVFASILAQQADIFVQDAFSNAHRDHASMTSIPKFMPSCAGFVVDNEIKSITNAIESPKRPFTSIIGGVKADKLNAVMNLLDKADAILIGGALAFSILKTQGYSVGRSRIDDEGLEELKHIVDMISKSDKVVLPVDCAVGKDFSNKSERMIKKIDEIEDDEMALDIGPETISKYLSILSESKTVIWNGPIGVFEFDNFREGTERIARHIASLDATVVVGGGDSSNAMHTLGLTDITHLSSGGGASLELFEGKPLIAIEALKMTTTVK